MQELSLTSMYRGHATKLGIPTRVHVYPGTYNMYLLRWPEMFDNISILVICSCPFSGGSLRICDNTKFTIDFSFGEGKEGRCKGDGSIVNNNNQ